MLKTHKSYMTQKTIKIFMNETYSKPSKRKYSTNKTDVFYIDFVWSLDILDLKDYGPENNRNYRCILVVIDNFAKFGFIVPLKNKNAQTVKDSFENIITSSKKTKFNRNDRGKNFYNVFFSKLPK